jgi:hypothetical protein
MKILDDIARLLKALDENGRIDFGLDCVDYENRTWRWKALVNGQQFESGAMSCGPFASPFLAFKDLREKLAIELRQHQIRHTEQGCKLAEILSSIDLNGAEE